LVIQRIPLREIDDVEIMVDVDIGTFTDSNLFILSVIFLIVFDDVLDVYYL